MNIKVTASSKPDYDSILSTDALGFIAELQRAYNPRRLELLQARQIRQTAFDNGELPDFLAETQHIREENWSIGTIPKDLRDRRVEITGPVDRKMIINALNSQALAFMADFEDSSSPTWDNMVQGQINLRDAINREIDYIDASSGKHYALNEKTATLIIRPRGWHLQEQHVLVDDEPMSASIFDFALYFFHNAKKLLHNGSGPYFYLPKLESHKEARLWNDIFITAQEMLAIDAGTIKATVLIETLPAAFEMDEILYELREHMVGLNCGRWDYIFSFIKKFRNNPACVLPDRTDVTMTSHFLKSYVELLIQTCHKRGAYAMGGMAAQIPIKTDADANQAALDKVMADKLREAQAGHDGTWVAHPGLIPTALNAFNQNMHGGHNQLEKRRDDIKVTAADLLQMPNGKITEQGFINNISIGIQYLAAWLDGNGCVPIYHLMEDAATAEISRAQLWQWLHHRVTLDSGQQITATLFDDYLNKALQQIKQDIGMAKLATPVYQSAIKLFSEMIKKREFDEFLTLPAYELLINQEAIKHE